MIRILSYGQRYVVTCPVCNAKFEYGIDDVQMYTKSEIRWTEDSVTGNRSGSFTFNRIDETGHPIFRCWNKRGVKCPVCTSIIEDGLYEKAKTEMDRDGTSESVFSGYCEADEDKRKIKDLRYCSALNNFFDEDCPCYKEESND